jgi:hypothetical protein
MSLRAVEFTIEMAANRGKGGTRREGQRGAVDPENLVDVVYPMEMDAKMNT